MLNINGLQSQNAPATYEDRGPGKAEVSYSAPVMLNTFKRVMARLGSFFQELLNSFKPKKQPVNVSLVVTDGEVEKIKKFLAGLDEVFHPMEQSELRKEAAVLPYAQKHYIYLNAVGFWNESIDNLPGADQDVSLAEVRMDLFG